MVRAIVTAPPYATFLEEVARHPVVTGFRLNTVMPVKGGPREALRRLQSLGKPLWVDLKGRQLRSVGGAIPPYTEMRISHPIRVQTPVDAFFCDGNESSRVVDVEEDRIILEDGPRRFVGPVESINIVDPSLEVLGTLTETDRLYLQAMKETDLRRVMISYVQSAEDAEEVQSLLPGAEIMLKIESRKGLDYARVHRASQGTLMAARGDLYIEIGRPHQIVSALREIVALDPEAVVASRLFDSLVHHSVPDSADIGDVAFLISLGYRTFLFGDAICLRREPVIEALNLLRAVASEFP